MARKLFLYFLFINYFHIACSQNMSAKTYTWLALGDSYTIGEAIPVYENFPYQTVQSLRKLGYNFQAPEIVARTGWTTNELQVAIKNKVFQSSYDFVSLLIGVNNQYRGRSLQEYATEFESLLKQSIRFAGNMPEHVFVLSIPDWGITPFAEGRNRQMITTEIDAFNAANKQIAQQYKVHYIDITPGTREAVDDDSLLSGDKLHPSGKEYRRWAEKLARDIKPQIQ